MSELEDNHLAEDSGDEVNYFLIGFNLPRAMHELLFTRDDGKGERTWNRFFHNHSYYGCKQYSYNVQEYYPCETDPQYEDDFPPFEMGGWTSERHSLR